MDADKNYTLYKYTRRKNKINVYETRPENKSTRQVFSQKTDHIYAL